MNVNLYSVYQTLVRLEPSDRFTARPTTFLLGEDRGIPLNVLPKDTIRKFVRLFHCFFMLSFKQRSYVYAKCV